ncbi:hypothetical protein Pan44_04610 [Caulifigura coniformis]|uniref:DUF2946 domain-containing protein n=1 Tax=Caulifigura coniformis TaxID=2527983 RepID=A0A517S8K1_9PLAN|nr:hypothetical protein [Caulifigura coniformis]QDT52449.1 hypothetical protein Pan44_04610 [Caulifigura coniformis]
MTRRTPSLEFASRLSKACLAAFYAAIALLGSGGLHAVAPHVHSACCPAEEKAGHTHHGCTHHHHHHPQPAQSQAPESGESPSSPCPDGCLICEFAATPAVSVALVTPPLLPGFTTELAPLPERSAPARTAARFWIRGPPELG